MLTPLQDLLGWQNGLRAALSVTVLLAAGGLGTLVYCVEPRRGALAFVAFPLALTWHFYMGFFAFAVGSALGLFIVALGVRWREPTGGQRGALGLLLLLEAVAHIFSAVLTGLVLFALMVARAPRGRRLVEAAKMALMGLPAAGILAATVVLGRGVAKMSYDDAGFAFAPASQVLAVLPRTFLVPESVVARWPLRVRPRRRPLSPS